MSDMYFWQWWVCTILGSIWQYIFIFFWENSIHIVFLFRLYLTRFILSCCYCYRLLEMDENQKLCKFASWSEASKRSYRAISCCRSSEWYDAICKLQYSSHPKISGLFLLAVIVSWTFNKHLIDDRSMVTQKSHIWF